MSGLDDAIAAVGEPEDHPAATLSLEDTIAAVDAGKPPPKSPEDKHSYDTSSAAGKYLKGATLGNVHQTLGMVPTENPILHPIDAARSSLESLKAVPEGLSSAAKTAMRWIADPVRAAKPYTQMDPETAGFATGPTVAQTAIPLFGALGKTNEALTGLRGVAGSTGRAAASGLERIGIGSAEDWKGIHAPPAAPQDLSMGAAQSHPLAAFAESSPELQKAAKEALDAGYHIDPAAAARHIAADKLGIRLSAGMASQDPAVISNEINARGTNGMIQIIKENTDKLKNHFAVVRDETMPDVNTTNMEGHGNTLKEGYQQKAAAADAEIDGAYQDLRDAYAAKGGEVKVDPKALFDQTVADLKSKMQYQRAIKMPEFKELENAANSGDMNFEQYELHRSNLAQVMRGSDAADRGVAYTMRKSAEQMPLAGETAELKPLADRARSLAKAKFDAIEADPAYSAAIKDKLSGEQFANKFVTGNAVDPRNIVKMRAAFADNPTAQQTITRAAFDKLRKEAGINDLGEGTFKFNQFKNAYQGMEGRANELFDPATKNHLDNMQSAARSMYQLPEGHYANTSNTFVAMMKDAAEHGIRGLVYAKGGPLAGLGADWAREKMANVSAKRAAAKATKPLAGAIVDDTALLTSAKKP